jgi:hypothetical protein
MIRLLLLLILACVSVCHAQSEAANVIYSYEARSCHKGKSGFSTAIAAANDALAAMVACGRGSPRNVVFTSTPSVGGTFTFTAEECRNFSKEKGTCFDQFGKPGGAWISGIGTMEIFAYPTCSTVGFSPTVQGDAWVCSPSAKCPASGTAATLGRLTTIASITETGWIVPAGSMPNPQCKNKCRVQHPGGSLRCTGYYPINGLVVGGSVYSSCSAEVTHTGTPCNYGGAGGIETLPEWVERPATYTLTEGNDDGGGDGGSDSEVLSWIGENTEQAATTLSTIAKNQVTSDQKAFDRNKSLLDKLDELLVKLKSIDDRGEAGGGGGDGNGGGDGTGKTTGGESVGEVNLDIDAPSGGLKSPGETNAGFKKLLAGTGINRAAGSCPTWTFDIKFLSVSPVMDTHCTLWSQNTAVFESLMIALWTLGALFLVLSA